MNDEKPRTVRARWNTRIVLEGVDYDGAQPHCLQCGEQFTVKTIAVVIVMCGERLGRICPDCLDPDSRTAFDQLVVSRQQEQQRRQQQQQQRQQQQQQRQQKKRRQLGLGFEEQQQPK